MYLFLPHEPTGTCPQDVKAESDKDEQFANHFSGFGHCTYAGHH